MTEPTISSSYLKSYVEALIGFGVSGAKLYAMVPGGARALSVPTKRHSANILHDILEFAETVTGKKDIGLDLGLLLRPETFNIAGQAIMVCRTLREAAFINHKYQPLYQQFGSTELKMSGGLGWLYWNATAPNAEALRRISDAAIVGHAQFTRWLMWKYELPFDGLYLMHARTDYAEKYEEIFKCPIHFSAPFNALSLDAKYVGARLPQANAEMLNRLRKDLDVLLGALETPQSYGEMVSDLLSVRLEPSPSKIEEIAGLLNLSPRSLRRYLSGEGKSFRALLESARQARCEALLLDGLHDLAALSSRLGYSEQSAFQRAFKRWYGITPRAYIKSMKVFETAMDQLAP